MSIIVSDDSASITSSVSYSDSQRLRLFTPQINETTATTNKPKYIDNSRFISNYHTFSNVRNIERNILCMQETANNLKRFANKLIDIMCKNNKLSDFKKLLLSLFTNKNINKYLNDNIISEILTIFSVNDPINDEQINIKYENDSVQLSELMYDEDYQPNNDEIITKTNTLSMLQIPTDILLHINHYLIFEDIINICKTCRYFRILSHHPISLHNLNVEYKNFNHYRYDHIQHLIFGAKFPFKNNYWISSTNITVNRNWINTVNEITISTDDDINNHIHYNQSCIGLTGEIAQNLMTFNDSKTLGAAELFARDIINSYFTDEKDNIETKNIIDYNKYNNINMDNIRILHIKTGVQHRSFYKFILYSFKFIEYLTIDDQMNDVLFSVENDSYNMKDICLFNHLKKFHYVINNIMDGNYSKWLSFANGIIDINNIYFKKEIDFIVSVNDYFYIHDRSNWQTIITKTFDSLHKFNQIYIKIYYENINDTNIQLNKLLQYLILNLESECSNNNKIITIEFIRRNNKQIINENESIECKYLSPIKTTGNAIKINIEFNNELIDGYLCFKNRNIIQLNNEYGIWKILTDKIDNINEQIIFECDKIIALVFICNSWQQLCTNGQVMIHYNSKYKVAIIRLIDKSDNKIKILQYIDGLEKATLSVMNCMSIIKWTGKDFVKHNMNPISKEFQLQFMDNVENAKQFQFCFNQYIKNDNHSYYDITPYRCYKIKGYDEHQTEGSYSWTETGDSEEKSNESDTQESPIWALEQGFSGTSNNQQNNDNNNSDWSSM